MKGLLECLSTRTVYTERARKISIAVSKSNVELCFDLLQREHPLRKPCSVSFLGYILGSPVSAFPNLFKFLGYCEMSAVCCL
jgi:hypothetical protein